MDYIVGIDAGGTKTSVIVYDLMGKSLWYKDYGPGNIVLQEKQTIHLIQTIINEVLHMQTGNCLYVLAGLAGFSVFNQQKELSKLFQYDFPVEFVNDAELALLSKHHGRPGLLAIAGTGSVFYGKYQDQLHRVGGWGHILGDEGSGYALGLACYHQLTKELDASQELSNFSKKFLMYMDYPDAWFAIRKVYQLTKQEIARAALFLVDESENELAIQIQKEAANQLATGVQTLLQHFPKAISLPLAVAGSVLEKNDLIFNHFCDQLAGAVTEIIRIPEPNNQAVIYRWQEVKQ